MVLNCLSKLKIELKINNQYTVEIDLIKTIITLIMIVFKLKKMYIPSLVFLYILYNSDPPNNNEVTHPPTT